jgi:large subunit ribosomal protein L22
VAFGTKTNERPGTRAQTRYARVSAYKAREVLDLIRGEPVARAAEILEFTERDVAQIVVKTLDSAVANAENNDSIPADELYVSACYADEGPTLKRWRPRARGRATRIRKRTTHITLIVSRYAPDELETRRARDEARGGRGGGAAATDARRRRVEKSRARKAEKRAAEEAEHDHDHDHDDDDDVADEIDTDHRDTDIAAEAAIDEAIDEVAPELADDDTRPDPDTDTDTDDAPTAGDDPATEEEDD